MNREADPGRGDDRDDRDADATTLARAQSAESRRGGARGPGAGPPDWRTRCRPRTGSSAWTRVAARQCMAWRVLATSKILGANPSRLVGPPVRTVPPLLAALLIGGGGTLAVLIRLALLLRRSGGNLRALRVLKPFATGISGAGVGAALVFLRAHGLSGLPTLALAAGAAGFFAKHSSAGEFAPRHNHRQLPPKTAQDAAFAATQRFVTPPALAFGQVSHYAPPRVPANRYAPSPTGISTDTRMLASSSHSTPASGGEPQRFHEQAAGVGSVPSATPQVSFTERAILQCIRRKLDGSISFEMLFFDRCIGRYGLGYGLFCHIL